MAGNEVDSKLVNVFQWGGSPLILAEGPQRYS